MGVHAETGAVDVGDVGEVIPAGESLGPLRRINVSGDLDDLLDRRPLFRTRLHGYDRLQVDNYATWMESELTTARRQSAQLLSRYGQCAAELETLRARPHRAPEMGPVTARLQEMLRVAAEEAQAITAAGIDEAERVVAGATAEAAERLKKVELIREAALAAGEEVRRERSEASGVLARARAQAAEILREANAERERLAAETARLAQEKERMRRQQEEAAAAAAARLAAVQAEVDDLRRQRDDARESLRRLTARIGEAVQSVAPTGAAAPADAALLAQRREPLATSAS